MAITITYGGLNLNDGTTYKLLDGFDPGERTKTFDEYRGYGGTAAQANVSEANLIEMRVPLKVMAASLTALHTAINAINAIIDAGPATFVWNDGGGSVSYSCVHSPRVHYVPAAGVASSLQTRLTLVLYRTP